MYCDQALHSAQPMTFSIAFRRFVTLLAPISLAAVLAACGATQAEKDNATPVEKLYADAMDDAESSNYDRAIKSLDRIEGRAAGSILAQQAQLELAYLYWKTSDKVQALATIDRFIKLHPSSPALDYALYLQGLVNFNDNLGILGSLARQDLSERDQQAARDSYQSFRQLVDQFPQSLYADDARVRMNYIVSALAAYELHVARYYYRRGAYVAAANRAQVVISEFQQSPSAEEALFVMMQSYDKLGLTELRDDAERVLKKSFPQTTIQVDGVGSGQAKKPWWQVW